MDAPIESHSNEDVVVYEPSYDLKDLLDEESGLAEIFTPERIEACQKLVADAGASFFTDVRGSFETLKLKFSQLIKSNGQNSVLFDEISLIANDIRGQAALFGYELISHITTQIIDCCKASQKTKTIHMSLAKELLSALQLVLDNKIVDDGGELGKSLMADLARFHAKQCPAS